MDVGVIEGVIPLRSGSHPAGLAPHWLGKNIQERKSSVCKRGIGFVVANSGPSHVFAQDGSPQVEDGVLIIVVRAVVVGIVAEQQPDICLTCAGVIIVGVSDTKSVPLACSIRARIAYGPDPC